ncbi:MAG: aspartyl protease family protein, partial [Gammaproteobacteria bacterium]|nr:aspartyl protease family protein [Gammaproteobacteria bacterium]
MGVWISGQPKFSGFFGPTLNVQIGFDPAYQPETGEKPHLANTQYHALVDTGAAISCIDNSAATALQLPVIDEGMISGASGANLVNIYLAQIYIPAFNFTE